MGSRFILPPIDWRRRGVVVGQVQGLAHSRSRLGEARAFGADLGARSPDMEDSTSLAAHATRRTRGRTRPPSSTPIAAPAARVDDTNICEKNGGMSQLHTSMHLRRLLTTIATLALLGSLVAIAPASVAASAGHTRTITKAGSGSIRTGHFTPSAQTSDPLDAQDE